ncbi:MAG: hypothetical protein IJ711_07485, partial [Lachnospiraceae bacterium]|nr:hypothetical protein [Lachnospiraceae bacterium]
MTADLQMKEIVMNEVGKKIVFGDIQLRKGNKQKRVRQELYKNLAVFKALPEDDEFDEVYDYLQNNKFTNRYISVNLFPKRMDLLGRYTEVEFTDQVRIELRWHMKTFAAYKEAINAFLEQKAEIDRLILQNRYEQALEALEEIERRFGFSYWLLENKIFLWNRFGRDVHKEMIEKSGSGMMTTILSFYQMRAAGDVSSRDYDYFSRREIGKFRRRHPDKVRVLSFYHYMIAPFSFEMDDENICDLLKYVYKLPLIDRYLCIIDICEYILTESKNAEYERALADYVHDTEGINDPTLTVFRFMLDTQENRRKHYELQDAAISVKSSYIMGNLQSCYDEAADAIRRMEFDASVYNIYIETCQMLGKAPEEIESSENIKLILKNLNTIYSIGRNFDDALDEVYKLCFCSMHAVWARDLYNHIIRRIQPYKSDEQKVAVMYSNMQKLTAETVCENLREEDAADYLNSLEERTCGYIDFRKELTEGHYAAAANRCALPALRVLLRLLSSNEIEDFRQELLENTGNTPIWKNRYAILLWDQADFDTHIEESIDYFLHVFMQSE